MDYFTYGEKEIAYLKKKDKKLGAAIDRIGMIKRQLTTNPFQALIESIVSQQISSKSAETVYNRLLLLLGELNPEIIYQTDIAAIQKCGMSMKKAGYIKGIAEAALQKTIDFDQLPKQTDMEVIQSLTQLKGVGIWTAEMLLIFSLNRPNVVSYSDLGIRRSMMNLYNLQDLPKDKFETYKKRYSPYGSTASLYLWAVSRN